MWKADTAPLSTDERKQPPAAPLVDQERRLVAWVGKSVVFKGDLSSSEDMTIDGRVQGTVELRDHALTIGPHGEIRGDIAAKTVTIRGAVIGSIVAGDKVVLSETGSVEGDITAPRLALADGAKLRGRVDTMSGTETSNVRPLVAV